MERGVRLACERCDYQADLYAGARPEAGDLAATADTPAAPTPPGAWSAFLCPECLEPIAVSPPVAAAPAPTCPRCESPLLDFATAARELAAASHSRTTLDLRAERTGRDQAEALAEQACALDIAVAEGRLSMAEALATLRAALAERVAQAAGAVSPWAPLEETTALAGLPAALAAAPTLTACVQLLRARLLQAERHIESLEQCIADEAELPGVPCPRCGTGQLLHWPFWQ
jgi:hypothetical protein